MTLQLYKAINFCEPFKFANFTTKCEIINLLANLWSFLCATIYFLKLENILINYYGNEDII